MTYRYRPCTAKHTHTHMIGRTEIVENSYEPKENKKIYFEHKVWTNGTFNFDSYWMKYSLGYYGETESEWDNNALLIGC